MLFARFLRSNRALHAMHEPPLRLAAAGALAVLTQASVVHAGPPEWLAQVVVDPQDPTRIVLAYENRYGGLLFSSDSGAHFDMRCMYSMDTGSIKSNWDGGGSSPTFGVTAKGVVLVPVSTGLSEGDFNGCGFSLKTGNPGFGADALARHPSDPNVYYAYMTPGYDSTMTCGRRGLVRRNADGSYDAIGKNDTTRPGLSNAPECVGDLFVRSIATVAHNGKIRIYEAGSRYIVTNGNLPVIFRFTEDDGATFTEHPLSDALNAIGVTPNFVLVNPQNPDQFIIRFHDPSQSDALYITSDAGATFTPYLKDQVTNVSNALIDSTGALWFGDRGTTQNSDLPAGLWKAASFGATPTRISSDAVYCLAESGSALLGCSIYGFGELDRNTGALTERFNIKQTRDYVSCAGEDVTTACAPQMCNPNSGEGWCGPLHHAVAPVCDHYNSTMPCCGWPARDYDERASRKEPSDGTCRAVPPYYVDAGTALGDAGTSDADASANTADAGHAAADGAVADAGATPISKKKDGGCNVRSASAAGTSWGAWLLSGLAVASFLRRRRRTHTSA